MRRIHPLAILALTATLLTVTFAVMASPAAAINPCESDPIPDSCFVPHQKSFSQALTIHGAGPSAVISSPSGINCGVTCSANFIATADCDYFDTCDNWVYPEVTLSSPQANGYQPVWSGNCTIASGACKITVDGSTDVTVSSVDFQAPAVPTVTAPSLVKGSTAISATSSDNSGSTPSLHWSVDGVPLGGATSSITLGTGLPDGAHSVAVYAKDATNNVSSAAFGSVTLDNTPPVITIGSGPSEGSAIEATTASFGFVATDLHLDAAECALDAAPTDFCTTPFNVSGLALGAHSVTISAADGVGNFATVVRHFTVVAPGTSSTPGGGQANPPGGGSSLQQVAAVASASWKVKKKRTTVKKFALSGLPAGAQVSVTCKGTGCAFKKESVAPVNGKADLLKLFKKKSLKAKSRIAVTVTATGFTAKTFTFTTQAKKTPKLVIS